VSSVLCLSQSYELSGAWNAYEIVNFNMDTYADWALANDGVRAGKYIFFIPGYDSAVQAGTTCGTNAYVLMSNADYQSISGGFTGFNLADVAAILPAVALVWAVAWLVKRLILQLRNQL